MNFLEVCQEVHGICQIDGDAIVSVKNQTGMNARIVSWVNRAYQDIQRHRTDWNFRQELASIEVLEDQWQISNLRDSLEHMDPRSVTIDTSGNISNLKFTDYDVFYKHYQSRTRTTGKPTAITVAPNYDIYLNPIPSSDLTLNFWYTKTIDSLSENTDEPIVRTAHQDSIVWKAVIYYAEEEEAEVVHSLALSNYKSAIQRMELDLRPKTTLRFSPLA